MSRRLHLSFASLVLWTSAVAAMAADHPSPGAARPPQALSRAAWMARGTFGVMTHYLVTPTGNTPAAKTTDFNRTVDRFDLDGYLRQFQESGADWLIFTLGQTTGYLCSRNAYLDGKAPGHTSHRDLALEIARRLKLLGKRLILYIPSEENAEPVIQQALDYGKAGHADRYLEFLRQYSLKFGTLHDGWWFDSCGPHPDEYWNRYLAAVRAGNPQSAVAFSGAEFCSGRPVNPICKLSDYHAGEIHLLEDGKIRRDFLWPPGNEMVLTADRKLRKRGQEARYYLPDAPLIDGIQWHCLLPIDQTFNPAIPDQFCHYTDKELCQFVRRIKAVGGAITINVPIENDRGHIPEDTHSQLVRMSKAVFAK